MNMQNKFSKAVLLLLLIWVVSFLPTLTAAQGAITLAKRNVKCYPALAPSIKGAVSVYTTFKDKIVILDNYETRYIYDIEEQAIIKQYNSTGSILATAKKHPYILTGSGKIIEKDSVTVFDFLNNRVIATIHTDGLTTDDSYQYWSNDDSVMYFGNEYQIKQYDLFAKRWKQAIAGIDTPFKFIGAFNKHTFVYEKHYPLANTTDSFTDYLFVKDIQTHKKVELGKTIGAEYDLGTMVKGNKVDFSNGEANIITSFRKENKV